MLLCFFVPSRGSKARPYIQRLKPLVLRPFFIIDPIKRAAVLLPSFFLKEKKKPIPLREVESFEAMYSAVMEDKA